MNKKIKYETPWLEVIMVDEDIITFSEEDTDNLGEVPME